MKLNRIVLFLVFLGSIFMGILAISIFLYAGLIYGLVFFVVLLIIVYLYWNSSIGPAQNDGLRLW